MISCTKPPSGASQSAGRAVAGPALFACCPAWLRNIGEFPRRNSVAMLARDANPRLLRCAAGIGPIVLRMDVEKRSLFSSSDERRSSALPSDACAGLLASRRAQTNHRRRTIKKFASTIAAWLRLPRVEGTPRRGGMGMLFLELVIDSVSALGGKWRPGVHSVGCAQATRPASGGRQQVRIPNSQGKLSARSVTTKTGNPLPCPLGEGVAPGGGWWSRTPGAPPPDGPL